MTRAALIRWTSWLLIAVPLRANAQVPLTTESPIRCATGAVVTGVATGGETGPLVGAAVGWSVAPRVTFEGAASWIDRGPGATAFTAAFTALIGERLPHRAAPFVKAGLGLYSATFDTARADIPDFYARRLAAMGPARRRFTDPAVFAGAGVNVLTTRRLSLRPEATAVIAWRGARTSVTSQVNLHVIFHFERHPVTPDRRTP
ncbi:MAG: hypothetical protein R2752_22615 [Vicinamibacterales bacterium]